MAQGSVIFQNAQLPAGLRNPQKEEIDEQQRGHAARELDERRTHSVNQRIAAQLPAHEHKPQRKGDQRAREGGSQRGQQALPQKAPCGRLGKEGPVPCRKLACDGKLAHHQHKPRSDDQQAQRGKDADAPACLRPRRLIEQIPYRRRTHRNILTFLSIRLPTHPMTRAVAQ